MSNKSYGPSRLTTARSTSAGRTLSRSSPTSRTSSSSSTPQSTSTSTWSNTQRSSEASGHSASSGRRERIHGIRCIRMWRICPIRTRPTLRCCRSLRRTAIEPFWFYEDDYFWRAHKYQVIALNVKIIKLGGERECSTSNYIYWLVFSSLGFLVVNKIVIWDISPLKAHVVVHVDKITHYAVP